MNKYESWASILSLAPNGDPYADAIALLNEANQRISRELSELHKSTHIYVDEHGNLDHIKPMSLHYYQDGVAGDMRRIGADFKCAAAKLFEAEGFAQRELSKSTRDKLLLNDEYCRYAK